MKCLSCLHQAVSAFAKDGGMTMMEALNYAQLDYVSLGNHECLDVVRELKTAIERC